MKAVVMAGGEGTRLRPLTSHRPKPLVPILNKPCMQHTIELLKRAGITDIVVTLYYLADEIEPGQLDGNPAAAGGGVERPFGGYKKSGFGREKGLEALRSFAALKTVVSRHG